MKKEHLMIGNFVYDKNGNVLVVGCIDAERILTTDGFTIPFDKIQPIPLTDEWCLRLGLKEGYFTEPIFEQGKFSINKSEYRIFATPNRLVYVHQLQNWLTLSNDTFKINPDEQKPLNP